MTLSLRRPLSEKELNHLETFLSKLDPPAMDLEMVDGFFTALVCGPVTVSPSQYLPLIWGTEFMFDSATQANELITILMRHWNTIARTLDKSPHIYPPILIEDNHGIARGNNWARGFLKAMHLQSGLWNELLDNEENGGALIPILMLVHEHDADETLRPLPIADDRRAELIVDMVAGVTRVYEYFRAQRSAPHPSIQPLKKSGRNHSCPCGSGLKYKRCCGNASSTRH